MEKGDRSNATGVGGSGYKEVSWSQELGLGKRAMRTLVGPTDGERGGCQRIVGIRVLKELSSFLVGGGVRE